MVKRTNTMVNAANINAYEIFNSTQSLTLENATVDLSIAQDDFNLNPDDVAKTVNKTNLEDDPVFRESKLASEFIRQQNRDRVDSILNFRIVPIWKDKMENVSKQIFNAGQCASFYDCVIWAFGEIYQLLDSVEPQLVHAAKLSMPDLERGYIELLSNETRGVEEVKNVSEIMLQAIDMIDLTDIFCGTLPKITHHPENTTVIKGNNISLKCYAEAVPFPTYNWYKNGERLVSGKDMMNLEQTNISDNAIYSCVAGNHIGNSSSSRALVSVVFAPEVTLPLFNQTFVLDGDNVTMTCTSRGIPKPLVEWHTSSTVTKRNSTSVLEDQLSIENSLPGHSGIYMCTVTNTYGSDNSNEAILHVLQGKPACPQLEVYVGYWNKPADASETVLHKAGIQSGNLEQGISVALKVLAKDIDDSLLILTEISEQNLIKVTVRINCKSVPPCTKLNCPQKHNELLQKVEGGWKKVEEKLDQDQALLAIDDQMYFLNPAIQDVRIITDTCQTGYRQFQEHVCVDANGGYVLPVPVINDLKPPNSMNVSWHCLPELEIFIKGYTVLLRRVNNSDILMNVTTNQTMYELPFSSTDDVRGIEIWIRVFTSSMQSAWTKRTLTDMSSTGPDTDAESDMGLVLGLSIGLTSAVCLVAVIGVLICVRSGKIKSHFFHRKLTENRHG